MRDTLEFLVEFFRNPRSIGAIAPSSQYLAREMVAELGLSEASLVLEFGPGTGACTGTIARRLPASADLLAIEQNSRMARKLRQRHPDIPVVDESVEATSRILRDRGFQPGSVDAIVSGLPWAAFEPARQRRLLDATLEVMAPGARFATFAYVHGLALPAARRFRDELDRRFAEVSVSSIVWRNLPPAFVYRCRVSGANTSAAFR